MTTIDDWKGNAVEVAASKGGTVALASPYENLVRTGISPWPPPEIVQKLYRSRQERAFAGKDLETATRSLGYYCDLQSMHSEDAITWSVFGTVAYSAPETRRAFVGSLLDLISVPYDSLENVQIWLWRRVPHPDTLGMGGPEIDFGVQTGDLVLFGEAKWLSGVARNQGKSGKRDQLALRTDYFKKYGQVVFGGTKHYVVVAISPGGGILESSDTQCGQATLHERDTTWESVCALGTHPLADEIQAYLKWKEDNTRWP
jgi:hypothetical protein